MLLENRSLSYGHFQVNSLSNRAKLSLKEEGNRVRHDYSRPQKIDND
jgi:hypothetical protein